ncbi:MAG: AMMECR1 domain-containing protein [Pseudonocardia sp.]
MSPPVRASALALGELDGSTAAEHGTPLPAGVVGVFVTVYAGGRLTGCAGGFGDDCGTRLPEFVAAAVDDRRFTAAAPADAVAVSVSLLFNRHEIGVADPDWVVRPTRFADQALQVRQRDRTGFVLPFVAVTHNLTPRQYVLEVIDKAGITRPPYRWTRYDCTTWLADGTGVRPMRHGLPVGVPAGSPEAQAERLYQLLRTYTGRHHTAPGEPYAARYDVFADRIHTGAHPARIAYGAWTKARAGLKTEALEDLDRPEVRLRPDSWLGPDDASASISELAFVLLTRIELGCADADTDTGAAMAAALVGQIDRHGRFATHRDATNAREAFQDYAPGQALLALAAAAGSGLAEVPAEPLQAALRYYRMRFRHNHAWGAVGWLTQACAAWGSILDDSWAQLAFEIVDWSLRFQSGKSGAFLNDHQRDAPGATTALHLEALAAARASAEQHGDGAREHRYRTACEGALAFLDSLIYQPRDAAVLPNPEWAIGGVRTSATASDVRIDFVHHALSGVLRLGGPR